MEDSGGWGVCEQLVTAAGAVLDQCESLVRAVPDEAYIAPSRSHRGGTLGKHVRHTLDHFAAALSVMDGEGVIDYDHRRRETPVETDRAATADAIDSLRVRLSAAASEGLGRSVRVRVMIDAEGNELELCSTLGRELAFATHHAVHHQAMMRAIAAEFGVEVDECFGKAPSTLNAERGRSS
jgi:Uncharacterized protein conserved in bacteria